VTARDSSGSALETQTDGQIVARVLAGDVDAYAILVARYRGRLGRYAVHMLGSREDAEEALQDSFVRAYRSLARCEDPEKFGAWIFRILLNRCRTSGARGARRRRTFVSDEVALLGASEEHPADRAAWREEIGRAVQRLRPDQREAFLMKYVEDLSYEEMSQVTGVGVSALKMRVLRACDRLRELLAEVHSAS
jgi:RNA polymerase sigma-70 factor (ECF subfamily)